MVYMSPTGSQWEYPTAFSGWGTEEYAAIQRVIQSGNFTAGAEVSALEKEFAAYHGMKHGIATNSGSSANLIAVAALFEGENPLVRGDTALVPALAWSTTYAPLVQYGLGLSLCDIDPDTWNADISRVPDEIQNCGLIVAVHILGNPCNEEAWESIARDVGAYFIVDCCESIGARDAKGQLSGTRGIGNTFSFYFSHQLSAIEGGMILTDNDDYAAMCRMLRNHGWSRGVIPSTSFDSEYDFRVFGYNLRPVEMHAAIAREQLKKLEARRLARIKNYNFWLEQTKNFPIQHPLWGGTPSPFGLHFWAQTNLERKFIAKALRAEGIDCRPPVGGSFNQHIYGEPWRNQSTPAADMLHRHGLFLGNAPFDISEQITKAVEVLKGVL